MAKKEIINNCKLCLERKKLCRSHLFPEFLHKSLYHQEGDSRHAMVISKQDEGYRKEKKQIGIREHLLCWECEQLLSLYEKYASEILIKLNELPPVVTSFEGIDYKHFKLFHLSILWRCSISQNRKLSSCSLGEKHNEAIRAMILSGDAKDLKTYPLFATRNLFLGNYSDRMIIPPCAGRIEARRVWFQAYGGFTWYVFVTSHPPKDIMSGVFSKEGRLVFIDRDVFKNPFLETYLKS